MRPVIVAAGVPMIRVRPVMADVSIALIRVTPDWATVNVRLIRVWPVIVEVRPITLILVRPTDWICLGTPTIQARPTSASGPTPAVSVFLIRVVPAIVADGCQYRLKLTRQRAVPVILVAVNAKLSLSATAFAVVGTPYAKL